MPRKKRVIAQSGIYHLFVHGVNRQTIFVDERDFIRMMTLIQNAPIKRDRKGAILSTDRCTIYAYCILGNHLHLLIKEGEDTISTIMQRINTAYATYYNLRYKRVGHLFQGVFDSEPIEDDTRFKKCFRYINRNTVKHSDTETPEAYPYSSCNEYVSHKSNLMKVIQPDAQKHIYTHFTQEELNTFIHTPNEDQFLDIDTISTIRTDSEAWEVLATLSDQPTQEEFRKLDPQIQIFYILQALERGVKRSQASRIGSLSIFQINKAISRKNKGIKDLLGRKKRSNKKAAPPKTSAFEESSPKNKVGENNKNKLMRGFDPDISLSNNSKVGENTKEGSRYAKANVATAPEELHDRIRQIPALNKNVYHKLHLVIDYLYRNPNAKCSDVAYHLAISNEATRKHLIRLSNENIIEITGKGKSTTYTLSTKLIEEINEIVKLENLAEIN